MSITLLRPNIRAKNYQGLATGLSAIEPPLWMALRATGWFEPKVIDAEVEDVAEIDATDIEIFPAGNHPSAYIPQKEGIKQLARKFQKKGIKVKVWNKLPKFNIDSAPSWGLFPMEKYRAHNWHCWGGYKRSPYGVVYSSYGCPFNCDFCCINDYYGGYKERDIKSVFRDIKNLVEKYNIQNIKFLDELFFLKSSRVEEICDRIIAEGYILNMWAYARLDTIKPVLLKKLKKAGFRWLGIGIESGNEDIRSKSLKGRLSNKQIKDTIQRIKDSSIHIGANYIFGFPDDSYNTMQETLALAKEINAEYSNFYTLMAYPGSQLHETAKKLGLGLPKTWSGYAQYSHDCFPLGTKHLIRAEVLRFRDEAFRGYYSDNKYLSMIDKVFGADTVIEISDMLKVKLQRKLYETQ